MSLSKVLRGEEAEGMTRWELPRMGGERAAAAAEPETEAEEGPARAPTAEELEGLRQRTRDEGYAEGRESGYQAGYDAGYKAGEREARKLEQEQKNKLQTLQALVDAQAQPLQQLDDEVHDELVRLVLILARQVIRRELVTQPGEILPVVREAVAQLPMGARDICVHVNPDDHRFLAELLGEADEERAWRLVDDPGLSRGGCRVEAERTRVDATLERRLAQLASQLLGGRAEDLEGDLVRADAPPAAEEADPRAGGAPDPAEAPETTDQTSTEDETSTEGETATQAADDESAHEPVPGSGIEDAGPAPSGDAPVDDTGEGDDADVAGNDHSGAAGEPDEEAP